MPSRVPRKLRKEGAIASSDMRALEVNAEYFGIPRLVLMENAGREVALEVANRFKPVKSIAIFCGLGGNGGDGFVAARHLNLTGYSVTILLAGKHQDIAHEAALSNWRSLECLQDTVTIHEVYDSSMMPEIKADIVIDALLGTGTKGRPRPPISQLIRKINSMDAFRIAVDIPSGIDADTGEANGESVKADLTITFHRTKKGLIGAARQVGELIVKQIGLPAQLENLAGPGDALSVIKARPSESHKGDFGRLLVIGGSETYTGAPALVALAALRTGVDLAYIASPEKTAYALSSMSPDLITIKLAGTHLKPEAVATLKSHIDLVDAVALGPGLGLHEQTRKAVRMTIDYVEKAGKPLLLDADALKAFGGFKRRLKVPLVLTPHAGEYAILTGRELSADLKNRISYVMETAAELNAVVLLKGMVDVIADGNRFKLNYTGNPGMTVGGTGDVLSGVVAALLAQGVAPFESAVAGAFVNGAAGDFVFQEKGYHIVASDLLDWIPSVLKDPMSHSKVRNQGAK